MVMNPIHDQSDPGSFGDSGTGARARNCDGGSTVVNKMKNLSQKAIKRSMELARNEPHSDPKPANPKTLNH